MAGMKRMRSALKISNVRKKNQIHHMNPEDSLDGDVGKLLVTMFLPLWSAMCGSGHRRWENTSPRPLHNYLTSCIKGSKESVIGGAKIPVWMIEKGSSNT